MEKEKNIYVDVLVLTEDSAVGEIILQNLSNSGILKSYRQVSSKDDFSRELGGPVPDVIISDYSHTALSTTEALRLARQQHPDTLFVVIAGPIGEVNAAQCITDGADMFVSKRDPDRMAPGIIDLIEKKMDQRRASLTGEGNQPNEKLYQALAENSVSVIWRTDKHLRLIYLSPSFKEFSGQDAGEWLGQPVFELFDNPVGIPNIRWVHKNALFLQNSSVFHFEMNFRKKDGQQAIIEITGKPIFELGTFLGIQGTAADITEKKSTENQLREKYRDLLYMNESLPCGLFRTDAEGKLTYVNTHWSILTGVPVSEATGTEWNKTVFADDRHITDDLVFPNQQGEYQEKLEFRYMHANGKPVWVACQLIAIYFDASFLGYIGSLSDITHLKEREEIYRIREIRLRSAIEKAPIPVMIHSKGKILQLSQAFTEISGYDIHELTTLEKWHEIAHPVEEEYNNILLKPEDHPNPDFPTGSWQVSTKKYGPRIWEFSYSSVPSSESEKIFVTSIAIDVTHKKQMEEELFRSRQELNAIFQGAPIMMFLMNIRREIIKINQTAVTYTRKSRVEILGKSIGNALSCHACADRIPCGEAKACLNCPLYKALEQVFEKTRSNLNEEIVICLKRGGKLEQRTYIINAERLFGDPESRVLLTLQDISDRKEAELELKKSEEKFRNLIENAPVGIALISQQGIIRDANAAVAGLFGFDSKEELSGKQIGDFYFRSDDRELFLQHLEEGTAFALETLMINRNGEQIWLMETAVKQDFPDGEKGYVSILEDINLRKENEEKIRAYQGNLEDLIRERTRDLEESNRQLTKLYKAIEFSPVSVVITDAAGNIEYVNPHFLEITGYNRTEAIGNNMRFIKSEDTPAEYYRELWESLKKGKLWHGQFKNRKKNGELFWELCSIAPIYGAKNEITHYVAVKQDITEKMKAEERLRNYTGELEIFNKSMVDRELRMIEMKQEVNEMCRQLGLPDKYPTELE